MEDGERKCAGHLGVVWAVGGRILGLGSSDGGGVWIEQVGRDRRDGEFEFRDGREV